MKKMFLLVVLATTFFVGGCEKDGSEIPPNSPRTDVPAEMQGVYMYGYFSMTEYWSQNPADYLGPALQFAIAFQFDAKGTYTQYFTSSSVVAGQVTYQQSVSKGTVEVDPVNKTFKTHPYKAHYKRTRNGQVLEERDLKKSELNSATTYGYATGVEPNGTKALYLTLQGTSEPLTFLYKQ